MAASTNCRDSREYLRARSRLPAGSSRPSPASFQARLLYSEARMTRLGIILEYFSKTAISPERRAELATRYTMLPNISSMDFVFGKAARASTAAFCSSGDIPPSKKPLDFSYHRTFPLGKRFFILAVAASMSSSSSRASLRLRAVSRASSPAFGLSRVCWTKPLSWAWASWLLLRLAM